jgi:hypothetical protein
VSEAPDYAAPIEGWRLWLLVSRFNSLRLRSLFYDAVWTPGEPLQAQCLHERRLLWPPWRKVRPDHGAPLLGCACGVYAMDEASRLSGYVGSWYAVLHRLQWVAGRVSLWGSVIECEHGWRASNGYPAELYVPVPPSQAGTSDGSALAEQLFAYGVPVKLVADGPALDVLGALAGGGVT